MFETDCPQCKTCKYGHNAITGVYCTKDNHFYIEVTDCEDWEPI